MTRPRDRTIAWEWAGIAAAFVIVLALPAYYLVHERDRDAPSGAATEPRFVGSSSCRDCHNLEFDAWLGSHHDLAMDLATDDSVLGDFDNAEFTSHGITSRFYRRDGRYFAYTNGPGGEMGEFEITHTFGWFPLQQYLVPFPGGRLQALHIAWDSRDNRWFLVSPTGPAEPDDWLYWTNGAQNWNGMCAQCHSTNLDKNYDPETDSYATTWSDIDVGCEACHGPGSEHVAWAELPEMARPQVANFDLARRTSGFTAREQVEQCAPCHSRRAAMGDLQHTETDLLDSFLPSLLTGELYFADGQILEEVYVYGSLVQSKMYRQEVRCSDCHDVHSIERVLEGNALCLQCHRAEQYDSYEHHFHKEEGEPGEPIRDAEGKVLFDVGTGASCEQCHMPGRDYMVVDYRPDHSFRIPDPALAAAVGAPDACLRCHVERAAEWSQQTMVEWYGPGRRAHYGTVIARGRAGEAGAADDLARLAGDTLYPVNVRATALSLLAEYPGELARKAMEAALLDGDALMRRTALGHWRSLGPGDVPRLIGPLLYDPVLTVRAEAARRLAGEPSAQLHPDQKVVYEAALKEFETAMLYSADFASARHNLGNLHAALNRPDRAIREFREALRIDRRFYPAAANLAVLYSSQGENEAAEAVLRDALDAQPEAFDLAYSLGLLFAEMQRYDEAEDLLEQASRGMPGEPRIHYNLGLLYLQLKNLAGAERELRAALDIEPGNLEFQYGLASFYLNQGRFEEARPIAEAMAAMHPDNPTGMQMLEYIRRNAGQ